MGRATRFVWKYFDEGQTVASRLSGSSPPIRWVRCEQVVMKVLRAVVHVDICTPGFHISTS